MIKRIATLLLMTVITGHAFAQQSTKFPALADVAISDSTFIVNNYYKIFFQRNVNNLS